MMSSQSTAPTAAAPAALQPIVFILALALRLRERFAEVRQSATLLVEKARAQIHAQRQWGEDVRKIDDEMEAAAPLLWECLKNDAPWKRKKIWTAWQHTHERTEQAAKAIAPNVPDQFLHD